jgi:hypothetical protein
MPVAPDLLLGGDLDALNPITTTPAPITMAPTTIAPTTMAPLDTLPPVPILEDDEEPVPFWTPLTLGIGALALVLVAAAIYYFFIRKGKGGNNKKGNTKNIPNNFFNNLNLGNNKK